MWFVITLWNTLGFIFWIILANAFLVPGMVNTEGIEFVNPKHIYKEVKVNWFGAFFLATLYGAMCPIATLIYWFYKACTVGRK